MTGWNIGLGVVVLLVLLALVILPRRAAARRRARDGRDGAGFWMTGDTGRSDPDRDKATSDDANDTGGSDGGDGGGGGD